MSHVHSLVQHAARMASCPTASSRLSAAQAPPHKSSFCIFESLSRNWVPFPHLPASRRLNGPTTPRRQGDGTRDDRARRVGASRCRSADVADGTCWRTREMMCEGMAGTMKWQLGSAEIHTSWGGENKPRLMTSAQSCPVGTLPRQPVCRLGIYRFHQREIRYTSSSVDETLLHMTNLWDLRISKFWNA